MAQISLRGYNREIESLIDRGQIDEAIAHCKHILKKYPKHIGTYRLLGKCYLETQRYIEATDILQRVLTVYPDDFISQIGMSIVREDEGNLESAIWHMERAFEVQPSNSAVQGEIRRLFNAKEGVEPPKVRLTHGALIRMYAKSELHQQAIAEAKTALAEDPERVDLEVILAKMYYQIGQKNEAADVCTKILKNLEYCYDANKILSEILIESNKPDEAKIYLQKIAAVEPYAAFTTAETPNYEDIDENMVMLEKLEWQASEYESQRRTKILGVDTQELVNFSQEPEENFNTVRSFDQGAGDKTVAIPKSSVPLAEYSTAPSANENVQQPETILPSESEKTEIPQSDLTSQQETLPIEALQESPEESIPTEIQGLQSLTGITESAKNEVPTANEEGEAIPDWMKSAGWSVSDGTTPETPIPYEDSEEAPSGPIQPAEIPDWLQSLAPAESDETIATPEDQEKMELLNRILPPQQEMEESNPTPANPLPEQIMTELPTEELGSQPLAQPLSEAAIDDSRSEQAETNLAEPEKEELPDWLKTTAKPLEQELPISVEETSPSNELPDWLRINDELGVDKPHQDEIQDIETIEPSDLLLDHSKDVLAESIDVPQYGSEEKPSELIQHAPELLEPNPNLSPEDMSIPEGPQNVSINSESYPVIEEKPEWLQETPLSGQVNAPELSTPESLPEWMQEESGVGSSPVISPSTVMPSAVEETPEWLKDISEETSTADSQIPKVVSKIDEGLPSFIEEPSSGEIVTPPQAVPEWLKEVANTSELSDLDNELLPSWAKMIPSGEEVQAETADVVTPTPAPELQDSPSISSQLENIEAPLDDNKLEAPVIDEIAQAPHEEQGTAPVEDNKSEAPVIDENVQTPNEDQGPAPVEPAVNPIQSWLENLNQEEESQTTIPSESSGDKAFFDELSQQKNEIFNATPEPSQPPEIAQPQSEQMVSEIPSLSDETLVSKPYSEAISTFDNQVPQEMTSPTDETDLPSESPKEEPSEPVILEESNVPGNEHHENALKGPDVISAPPQEPLLETPEMIDDSISAGSDLDLESWLNSLEEVTGPAAPPTELPIDSSYPVEQSTSLTENAPIVDQEIQPVPAITPIESEPELKSPVVSFEAETQEVSNVLEPEIKKQEAGWLAELNITPPTDQILPEERVETETKVNDDTQIGKKVETPVSSDKTEPSLTFEDILNHANKAMEQGNIPDALKKFSILIKSGEKLEETIQNLRSAVYKHPSDVAIWQTLGDSYAKNNRLQEALDAYTKAEELLK